MKNGLAGGAAFVAVLIIASATACSSEDAERDAVAEIRASIAGLEEVIHPLSAYEYWPGIVSQEVNYPDQPMPAESVFVATVDAVDFAGWYGPVSTGSGRDEALGSNPQETPPNAAVQYARVTFATEEVLMGAGVACAVFIFGSDISFQQIERGLKALGRAVFLTASVQGAVYEDCAYPLRSPGAIVLTLNGDAVTGVPLMSEEALAQVSGLPGTLTELRNTIND